MIKLVWYLPDGTVRISTPRKRSKETELQGLDRFRLRKIKTEPEFANYDWEYVDETTLPDGKDRNKWRGNKGEGVKIDHSIVTQAEKRQAIENELDAELAKPDSTTASTLVKKALKIARLQRKLQKQEY